MIPKPLSQRQRSAIARLEHALEVCHEAGVALYGMDDQLIAYRADQVGALAEQGEAGYDIQKALEAEAYTIENHGAYRDSGGF